MKDPVRTEWLDSIDSTNNEALRRLSSLDSFSVLAAREQTAGRGQRGNRWLAAPGENLTFSLVFRPAAPLAAVDGFLVSQAASAAVCAYLLRGGIDARIKWPNDIYVHRRKICGMLIENSLEGDRIAACVIGIGINVNQRVFAPELVNPVSMTLLTGRTYRVEAELPSVCSLLAEALSLLETEAGREAVRAQYLERLYLKGVFADFVRCSDARTFPARIVGVDVGGRLLLENTKGERESFAFKEISYII